MLLHEDVISKSVSSLNLGKGEEIGVFTKMGRHIVTGKVNVTSLFGVSVESDEGIQFYKCEYHYYVPVDKKIDNNVPIKIVDKNIAEKEDDEENEKDDTDKVDDNKKKKEKDDEEDESSGEVDEKKLPDKIKDRVIDVKELDDVEIDKVVSAISDAAMDSMKHLDVEQEKAYETTMKIQKAVKSILTTGK